MSSQQIVTGDALVLDLRPARVPTRMLAALVDLAVSAGLSFLWWYVQDNLSDGSWAKARAASIAGFVLTTIGYTVLCEAALRGRTLGHLAFGLRVVRDDGGIVGFRHALMRGLAFWLLDFAPYTGGVLGLAVATVHPAGKRIGDLLAGTLVVRTRAPRTTRSLQPVPAATAAWAENLELSRVDDEDIAAARYALQRSHLLRAAHRESLQRGIAARIAAVTTPAPPPGLAPADYLGAVIAEHRRRAGSMRRPALGVDVPSAWR